ncbi:MAG: flavodoxin family protein [bacterium]
MNMKALTIAGSPRRGGNSELLLDSFSSGLMSNNALVEKVVLNELNLKPCQACGGCEQTGKCIIKDDMQSIYGKVKDCDLLIIASPIFFGSITGQLKMMIDRFQCWWVAKYILKRPEILKEAGKRGVFLSVGGMDKREYFEAAKKIIKIYFAVINIFYGGDLFYPSIDKRGSIGEHSVALKEAFELGERGRFYYEGKS